ncbi:ChrR family anti-sigma-E factor [Dichotomicrobium thermohalophilum]|uniref:ChrR-like anti-ECFsigma factor n=1 Tax=Dichotomicrobium thermohalophilum TaxID=933063 RepID=A0A397QEU5_9HYPH|nr:ChrR family anti-sigma-E factor [Dichotomicrobium thermohalophilum]RIA56574.1 ChrR-like anti-ECFsigma factor [Dichotomicrobium thermohalophilum]
MTITHHLDEATLMGLSAGALPEALASVAACHLDVCPSCRKQLGELDMLGGALLEHIDPQPLSDGLSERMASYFRDDNVRSFPLHRTRGRHNNGKTRGEVPKPLQRFIGTSLDDLQWQWLAPGIRQYAIKLPDESRGSLRLLRIKAGMRIPEHGHGGSELTLILRGAYHDRFGRFGPGDVADLDEDAEHEPRVDKDGECICLVATEEAARFKGLLSRVLQPLTGI